VQIHFVVQLRRVVSELETAVVIVPDGARPQLEPVRAKFHAAEVAMGIPLHVTLLYPFAPPDRVDEEALAYFFAGYGTFTLTLTGLATWPQVVYAIPEPRERLLAMMHALFEKYPEYPPYDGEIAEPEPHATLSELEPGDSLDEVAAGIGAQTESLFPLTCDVRDVALLEEYEPGRWRERRRFPLRA
jgi:2'-5' RNA ligase